MKKDDVLLEIGKMVTEIEKINKEISVKEEEKYELDVDILKLREERLELLGTLEVRIRQYIQYTKEGKER